MLLGHPLDIARPCCRASAHPKHKLMSLPLSRYHKLRHHKATTINDLERPRTSRPSLSLTLTPHPNPNPHPNPHPHPPPHLSCPSRVAARPTQHPAARPGTRLNEAEEAAPLDPEKDSLVSLPSMIIVELECKDMQDAKAYGQMQDIIKKFKNTVYDP